MVGAEIIEHNQGARMGGNRPSWVKSLANRQWRSITKLHYDHTKRKLDLNRSSSYCTI